MRTTLLEPLVQFRYRDRQLLIFLSRAIDFAEAGDYFAFVLLQTVQARFEVGNLVGLGGHAGVHLLDALGFEELDLGRNLLVKAFRQECADLLHRSEGQVVFDVDVRHVHLISQVLCRSIELSAHDTRLLYRLEQAGLPRRVLCERHAALLDGDELVLLPLDGPLVILDDNVVVVHHIFHIRDVVVEDADLSLEKRDILVHFRLRLDEVLNNFVVIFSEKAVDFILLESQSLHVLARVIETTVEQFELSVHFVDLLLQSLNFAIIARLILSLPGLGDRYPLVDLIKDFVAALLLVEASLHVLQPLAQLVVVQLQFFDDLPVRELVLQTRLYQVQHPLLHVCRERVVVHLLVDQVLLSLVLLLVDQLCKRLDVVGT